MAGLLLGSLFLSGCGEKQPDPREEPGFVDTSDPSKVMELPKDPRKQPGAQPEK
jgi:hypothetical protein